MNTFEEQFPELEGRVDEDGLISECDVEFFCLSKQKVKEAIESMKSYAEGQLRIPGQPVTIVRHLDITLEVIDELKERLGL